MRVAVIDIGSNSTRLLIADVDPATRAVTELERRSTVTRLGQGVDASGGLAAEAIDRVTTTLAEYRQAMDERGATANVAVLTSAVRDAANGPAFTARVRDDYGLDARTLTGDEEAQTTFLGATASRRPDAPSPVVVIDIGGGSTEFIVGGHDDVRFHVSTQAGVVRQSERHIHADPPPPRDLQDVTDDVRAIFHDALPDAVRRDVAAGIAVAGTATSCAAIAQELDPYDPARVHGYRLSQAVCQELLARLALMTDEQRRHVAGLHPDRAPTIVPGVILLLEAMRAFDLGAVEVSEHDILRGAALRLATGAF
jgi:exopolyphosphatase/guanosine-5'-triphosphate,3'-diphosphate pyrophosphatase